jgi:ribonuclease VapC
VIVDSSAVVAMVYREPGHEELERKMREAAVVAIGAPTAFEMEMVLTREYGEAAQRVVSQFLKRLGIVVVPFGEAHGEAAAEAFRRFGKGRHSARLNYGDCMSYATARVADEPLLYVGDDFAQTDIQAA